MNGMELHTHAPAAGGLDLGFRLSSMIIGKPMAMREADLEHFVQALAANRFTLPRNRKTGSRHTEKGTAIVEVHGILIDRFPILGNFWGMNSYEGLAEQFRRLATDPNIKRVVLDLDTPGGMVMGIRACADELARLAEEKPVYAIANNMMCSAGYWIGCVAQELSVTPDGCVGSIGVRAGHVSYAENLERAGVAVTIFKAGATKADLNPYSLLDDGAAAEAQFDIDRTYDRFCEHVAANRPLTADEARATDARTFTGEQAVEEGLADRVETLEELIERVEKSAAKVKPKRKPAIEPGSKAGPAPRERNPSPIAPDDETPSAGKSQGAKMSTQTLAEDFTAAIAAFADAKKAEAEAAAKAAAAPAKDAAAAAPAEAKESKDDIQKAERERVLGIIEAAGDGQLKMAVALAKAPGMSVEAAKEFMAAAQPAAPAKEAEAKDVRDTAFGAAMKDAKNSGGVKPEAGGDGKRQSFVDYAATTARKS